MEVPQKTKVELPHDPAICSWAYIQIKLKLKKIPAPHMFRVALFTTAKTWEQSKCSSTDEWIKKMRYTYIHTHTHTHTRTGILLNRNKEQNNAICSNKDGPRDYHTK